MIFRVRLSRAAQSDAEQALTWLREVAPERADRWFSNLMDTVLSLEQFPERCPLAFESQELAIPLRQLLYGKKHGAYRILFLVYPDDQIVFVVRIRHASRDRLTREDLEEALE